jgi:hypothetical protein
MSMDPGKWCLAWCAWADGALAQAGLSVIAQQEYREVNALASLHVRAIRERLSSVPERCYVEQMQLTQGRDPTRRKAIKVGNDLLAISNIAASVSSMLGGQLMHVPIRDWKGNAFKTITQARVLKTLEPAEQEILASALHSVRAKLHNNLYDAAGIGLHVLRRYRLR